MKRIVTASSWILAAFLALTAVTTSSFAQRDTRGNFKRDTAQHVPGKFDYYQLVLSWSPTHCADNSRGSNDTQCGPRRARPYSFVLHGLWPQYERGWPEFCRTAKPPFVENGTINSMMDIMPSRGLIIHQYKKHGTCSGLDAKTYFKASRIAMRNVKIPKMFERPSKPILITPADLVSEFRTMNPSLPASAIQVVCKRGNSNQLKEVKICMTRKGAFRECAGGRRGSQHKCLNKKMYVPPVRG